MCFLILLKTHMLILAYPNGCVKDFVSQQLEHAFLVRSSKSCAFFNLREILRTSQGTESALLKIA